jgi:hypothetical protein
MSVARPEIPGYDHRDCDTALQENRPEDACAGCRAPAPTRPRHSFEPVPDGAVSLHDMLATGASYRRLDHWVRQGWLSPTDAAPGSGMARTWTPRDLTIVKVMVRLTSVGIPAATAATWAAACADENLTTVTVNGVTITWETP